MILVKNLPANTTELEIKDLFSKYGLISRVVLPPSGVTGNFYFISLLLINLIFDSNMFIQV